MKEYKYKINGNLYNVAIGDIEDNIAHVEVNGTHYTVEMEKKPKAAPARNQLHVRLLSQLQLLLPHRLPSLLPHQLRAA